MGTSRGFHLRVSIVGRCRSRCRSGLVVGVYGVIDRVMQSPTLLALDGLARDEIAHVNHVA